MDTEKMWVLPRWGQLITTASRKGRNKGKGVDIYPMRGPLDFSSVVAPTISSKFGICGIRILQEWSWAVNLGIGRIAAAPRAYLGHDIYATQHILC